MYSQKGWIKEWIPCLLSHSLAVAGHRAGIEPPDFQMRGQSICQSLTGCQLVITNISSFALFCLQQKLHTLQHSGSIANIIVNSSRHFYSIITSVSPSVSGLKTQRNKKIISNYYSKAKIKPDLENDVKSCCDFFKKCTHSRFPCIIN